jgi:hypothetical protein
MQAGYHTHNPRSGAADASVGCPGSIHGRRVDVHHVSRIMAARTELRRPAMQASKISTQNCSPGVQVAALLSHQLQGISMLRTSEPAVCSEQGG